MSLTGQNYNDTYYVWKHFCALPEVCSITYRILIIAQQRGLTAQDALSYYLEHLGESPLTSQ
ncbi:hypothetical protein [Spirosoma agri]